MNSDYQKLKIVASKNLPFMEEGIINFCIGSENNIIFFSKEKVLNDWKISRERGRFFLAKDNFWTKDFPTTASSLFLYNFSTPYDATVIEALTKRGYILLGKSVLDEFACGGTGLFASQGVVYNPLNREHLVGGSSSGSAAAVAAGIVPFALGHDTGDSLRRPASYCGIFALKPSYGLISRYGIIPMAASLDTVGLLANSLSIIREIFKVISFPDNHDLVTISAWKERSVDNDDNDKRTIATIEGVENYLTPEYGSLYLQAIENFCKLGYKINKVELPLWLREHLQITYLVICSSELVSHLNSLQGVTFGSRQDLKEKSVATQRSQLLGRWVKERIILGAYFLSDQEIITRARQIRSLFKQWMKRTFSENSFLVFPGTISAAPRRELFKRETSVLEKSLWVDNLLLLANFNGSPSLNIPLGTEKGMPVSLNIDTVWGNDEALLKLAEEFLTTKQKE